MNRKGPIPGAENSHRKAASKGRGLGSWVAVKVEGRESKLKHPLKANNVSKAANTA